METSDIIIADRFTLIQPGNSADVYNALLDDTVADSRIRVSMTGVGNDQEIREIEEAWKQIETVKSNCRFGVQLAAQPKGKASRELHCDLSDKAVLACNAADHAMNAAIGLFHTISFRLHRKLETGEIPQALYDREQQVYQKAMAHLADSREVYQHLSSVWHDEYQERVMKVNSFGNQLGNWMKVFSPAR